MSVLFQRVRTRLSGFQADVDPHEWRLSKYSSPKKPGSRVTVVPDPAILRNAFVPNGPHVIVSTESSFNYPDIGHSAVHLCLLECFRNLRLGVSNLHVPAQQLPPYEQMTTADAPDSADTDDNNDDGDQDADELDDDTPLSPTTLPESQRWNLLIQLSVTRFTTWWMKINHVLNHASAYTPCGGDRHMLQLTKDYLPPLDVLLVWYAFMLNSDAYANACQARGVPKLQDLCFPWPAIRDSVDTETMTFTLSRAARGLFETLSEQPADIIVYVSEPPAYVEGPEMMPFDIDLFAEVKKHEKFIDQAHELLWIRGPSLSGSLERANNDYFKLKWSGKLWPIAESDMLPFGVNLMWRTHKLHTSHYQAVHGMAIARLETDVKILNLADESSDDEGEPQLASVCACWTCERIRDEIAGFRYDESKTPRYDSNILGSLSSSRASSVKDDVGFFRCVERARRLGRPLPRRARTEAEREADKQRNEDMKRWSSIEVPSGF